MNNKIWIELNRDADNMQEQCDLANKVLKKLGISHKFELLKGNGVTEALILDSPNGGGYIELPDGGHWFSLDYIAS